ncbi:hypothetical protein PoB_005109300 [Plakobranchus ocellatus]|uniref:Uncharacterized protein n=1 Tax=Plakobranchus ocellatus TaxID=259542 RepID=A0AAV4BZJ8_9GAST|nr:hypothetical protein PoB_005109300 [Plakobranchus ocellatus]
MIPDFQATRQARAPVIALERAKKGLHGSQGEFSICCDINAPIVGCYGLDKYIFLLLSFLNRKIHNNVISGFQALRQARAPVAGLEPATEDLRADSQATVLPTPPLKIISTIEKYADRRANLDDANL